MIVGFLFGCTVSATVFAQTPAPGTVFRDCPEKDGYVLVARLQMADWPRIAGAAK